MNNLEEFFPLLSFLREPCAQSFEVFSQNFIKRSSHMATQRLQILIDKVMLRRTLAYKVFGRPAVELPPISPFQKIEVDFNTVERHIYTIVRARFQQKIGALKASGGLAQNYSQILVLFLRLRQLVGHPMLIQKTLIELLEPQDLKDLWTWTKVNPTSDPTANFAGSKETAQALKKALEFAETFRAMITTSAHESDEGRNMCALFDKKLADLDQAGRRTLAIREKSCQACAQPPARAHLTKCLHLYCLTCLSNLWAEGLTNQTDSGPDSNPKALCMACNSSFGSGEIYRATKYDGMSFGSNTSDTNSKSRKTPDVQAQEDIDWLDSPGPVLRSTKVKAAIQKIIQWKQEDPTVKVLVFTIFKGLSHVLGRVLDEEGIGYARLDGSVPVDAREDAIQRFSTDPSTYVLLAGLKVAGTGLNITASNKVIILDLWWNATTEQQAICRSFRIGQTRAVEVIRFAVADSIDTDLEAMQQRKTRVIDSAMEGKAPRLTLKELVALFSPDKPSRQRQQQQQNVMAVEVDDDQDDSDEGFFYTNDPYGNVNDED